MFFGENVPYRRCGQRGIISFTRVPKIGNAGSSFEPNRRSRHPENPPLNLGSLALLWIKLRAEELFEAPFASANIIFRFLFAMLYIEIGWCWVVILPFAFRRIFG